MTEFEQWLDLVVGALGSILTAGMGVMMRQAHRIQQGEPSEWNKLWLHIPTIFVMGLGGHIASVYLHDTYHTPTLLGSFIAAWLGYLGPEAVQKLVEAWLERNKKKDD